MTFNVSVNYSVILPVDAFVSTTWSSSSNTANGVHGLSNTSEYASFTAQKNNTGVTYYSFDGSSIPSNATINSVSCTLRYTLDYSSNTVLTYAQLYNGSSLVGSQDTLTVETDNVTHSLSSCGTWTASELRSSLQIAFSTNNGSKGSKTNTLGFYGAEVTVNYTMTETIEVTATNNSSIVGVSLPSSPDSNNDYIITFTDISNLHTVSITDNGNNVTNDLVNLSGSTYTYTISSINGDHVIVIDDVVAYTVTVTDSSSLATVSPTGTEYAGEGSNFYVSLKDVTDINYIVVYDNNVKQSASSIISIYDEESGTTSSFIPTEYDSTSSTLTASNPTNGLNSSSNTSNYAQFTVSQTQQFAWYNFSPEVPSNILSITSITCTVRGYYSGNSTIAKVQLYSGSTTKGNSVSLPSSSGTVELTSDDWTIEEIENIKLRISGFVSGAGSGQSSSYIYFYGADLVIEYTYQGDTYYQYVSTNIQENHTIDIQDKPSYSITASSSFASATITPSSSTVYEDESITFTITVSGINSIILYDNSVNVTSSIINNSGTYQYTIESVEEAHVLSIVEAPYYSLSGSSTLSGVSFDSLDSKIYDGDDYTVSLSGVSNIYAVKLYDNSTDVTSSIVDNSGTYQYTISDVHENHTLLIEEQDTVTVTASSSYVSATVQVSSNSVYIGDSFTITITGISSLDDISVSDNGTMITGQFTGSSSTYTCTINSVSENHIILVTEHVTYTLTITNNSSKTVSPTGSVTVDAGDSKMIVINDTDVTFVLIKDNSEKVYSTPIGDTSNTAQSQTNSGLSSGSSYAAYAVGYTAESPNSSTGNMYASSGSTGYVNYSFDFSSIPEDANILSVEVKVYGQRESSTTDSTNIAKIGLYSGSTLKSTEEEFTSTTASILTIADTGTWTRAELQSAILKFTVGYYGGGISGITWTVIYSSENSPEYYGYILSNVSAAHTIIISDVNSILHSKNSSWGEVYKVWQKVNGEWIWVEDPENLFDSGIIYINRS